MTNIEKVKRIIDAGHWVKVTYPDGVIRIITSYYKDLLSYVRTDMDIMVVLNTPDFKDCTIEVIQRIPTLYKAWDKVLVLSNPTGNESMDNMVWKILEVKDNLSYYYSIFNTDKSDRWNFPAHCLAPAFDEPKEEPTLSGKEAKVTIDGKEYSVTLKLI